MIICVSLIANKCIGTVQKGIRGHVYQFWSTNWTWRSAYLVTGKKKKGPTFLVLNAIYCKCQTSQYTRLEKKKNEIWACIICSSSLHLFLTWYGNTLNLSHAWGVYYWGSWFGSETINIIDSAVDKPFLECQSVWASSTRNFLFFMMRSIGGIENYP